MRYGDISYIIHIASGNDLLPDITKLSPAPVLSKRQLDPQEQPSVKFESKWNDSH